MPSCATSRPWVRSSISKPSLIRKNTSSQLEQGRVYWTIRFTDVPPAENPIVQVEVTNQWITEVPTRQLRSPHDSATTNLNPVFFSTAAAGRVTEIQLPKLKRKTDGYRAGGMDAEVDMAVGLET